MAERKHTLHLVESASARSFKLNKTTVVKKKGTLPIRIVKAQPKRVTRNKSRYGATMDTSMNPNSYENYMSRDSSVNSLLKYARRQAE